MCVLCGQLVDEIHWTERRLDDGGGLGGGAGDTPRRRQRFRRTRLVDRVLRHYGLSVRDDWSATTYVVANRKGASELTQHLGELWPAAERLAGRRLDPLDPALLADLADDG
jgi:hypothetical protein